MAYEIIWTENATEDFDKIVSDLSDYTSEAYAIKFVNIFYEKLDLIAYMPYVGVQSYKRVGVRRLIITKNYSLAYVVTWSCFKV